MPHRTDLTGSVWRFAFHGRLTVDDLVEAEKSVYDVEASATRVPHRLIEIDELTAIELSFLELYSFICQRRTRRFANRFKSAIVATDFIHDCFARMYQQTLKHPQITVRIFGNAQSAMDWLTAPGKTAARAEDRSQTEKVS